MTIQQIKQKIAERANGQNNKVVTERQLWEIILNESVKLFEVKEIDVNLDIEPNYFVENFTSNGLGINDMEGFAICNGNNGTRNRGGRVAVGYGEGYTTIGATGGSKDAALVEHIHEIKTSSGAGGFVGPQRTNGTQNTSVTESAGSSGVGKNMQPFIIVLKIQRIA